MNTFEALFDSGLYDLTYLLLNDMVEDLRIFETLSLLDCSFFDHYNLYIMQAYRKTSLEIRALTLETVILLEKRNEREPPYDKKDIGGSLTRIDESI